MSKPKCLSMKTFKVAKINFENKQWHIKANVPSKSGWYMIRTTTPIDTLQSVGEPKHKGNYNIPKKIKTAQLLINKGLVIIQNDRTPYIVYSGEAKNLLSRAREHSFGGVGTGCLAINSYPSLLKYEWWFDYLECESVFPGSDGDKGLHTYGEQYWRSMNGWPILCSI